MVSFPSGVQHLVRELIIHLSVSFVLLIPCLLPSAFSLVLVRYLLGPLFSCFASSSLSGFANISIEHTACVYPVYLATLFFFTCLASHNPSPPPQFLAQKFETVFDKYNILLRSANYVTRRQSLKLLGELLLDRSNFQVMMRYIQASKKNT